MKLKCNRCGYSWEYKGKQADNIVCPICLHLIKVSGAAAERRKKTKGLEGRAQKAG